MTEPRITFSRLARLLSQLGFREVVVPESHAAFRHDKSETVIILPPYEPKDVIAPHHVLSVRMSLSGRGVMSESEFDKFIAESVPDRQPAAS